MTQQPDLRPVLARTQEWVATLIDGLGADQLDASTPCEGWTVGDLVQHLLAVEHRVAVLAIRGDVEDEPSSLPLPDDVAGGFREAARAAQQAWADDAVLDQVVSPPWGSMPGRAALGGYVQEHLVHGWDLAVATGQDPTALDAIAEQVLPMSAQVVPAHIRGEDWVPFGVVVEPAPDAGPTEQLVNWLGRTSR